MYATTFIFAKKQYDDEFYRLDGAIAETAKTIPGYLGEEAWENPSTGLVSNVYYWESLEALTALINHPMHLEAKAKQAKWLDGYQVVISEVIRIYGDGKLGDLPVSSVSSVGRSERGAQSVWSVWRQDDNGNVFMMSDGHPESEALRIVREFEAKGHKQAYWAKENS